jgi:hypothetical protein
MLFTQEIITQSYIVTNFKGTKVVLSFLTYYFCLSSWKKRGKPQENQPDHSVQKRNRMVQTLLHVFLILPTSSFPVFVEFLPRFDSRSICRQLPRSRQGQACQTAFEQGAGQNRNFGLLCWGLGVGLHPQLVHVNCLANPATRLPWPRKG